MGNNVASGHVIAATSAHQIFGFQKTLELLMVQHEIKPWSTADVSERILQKQEELCKISPLRFIPVEDGLSYFAQHAGGWISVLTREKFVYLTLRLLSDKKVIFPTQEATIFYDIFDSIDLYGKATLSVAELVLGLSSFFGGTFEQRTSMVYDLLDPKSTGYLSKSTLQAFVNPIVWCLVPSTAEVLRPILSDQVMEALFLEIAWEPKERITRDEFIWWMHGCQKRGAQRMLAMIPRVVISQVARVIDSAVTAAWMEHSKKESLRQYGRETWASNHAGETQRLHDVGLYRYLTNKVDVPQERRRRRVHFEKPTLLGNIASAVSEQGAVAYKLAEEAAAQARQTFLTSDETFEDSDYESCDNSPVATPRRGSVRIRGLSVADLSAVEKCSQEQQPQERPLPDSPAISVTKSPQKCSQEQQPPKRSLPASPAISAPLSALPPTVVGLTPPRGFPIVSGSPVVALRQPAQMNINHQAQVYSNRVGAVTFPGHTARMSYA